MNYHLSQSVSGALRNWPERTWRALGKDNELTAKEMRQKFIDLQNNGVELIPLSKECNGHDPITGCPGHEE